MKVITSQDFKNFKQKDICLAIGTFDGLHQGHQEIINKTIKLAETNNYHSGVLSFYPHPLTVIPNRVAPQAIISRDQKIKLLNELGLDFYFEQQFTSDFSEINFRSFVEDLLLDSLHVSHVIVGDDFRFGFKNEGNVELLSGLGKVLNFKTTIIKQIKDNDDKISSTRIRSSIKKGQLKKAEKLLGRSFQVCGKVVHGKKRGRTFGIPTANLKLETNYVKPPSGVYATKIYYKNEVKYGVANLGKNPTFENENLHFEVFIFDFAENIYGEELCLDLIDFIRPEEKFNSTAELVKQMKKDILYTRNLLC